MTRKCKRISHPQRIGEILPEELAAELTAIWIYCQSPILCQAEYKQALRLFDSTLRKYLAVKNFDCWRGFSEPSSTDSGTSGW